VSMCTNGGPCWKCSDSSSPPFAIICSHSIILNGENLREELSVTSEEIEKMKRRSNIYSFLDERRTELHARKLDDIDNSVKSAEEMHYRTLAFRDAIISNRRREAVQFLSECNYCGASDAFRGNRLKQNYMKKRERRKHDHWKREKAHRESGNLEADQDRLLSIKSHYGVLGVSKTASNKEIIRSFRRLAKIYHPHKNTVGPILLFLATWKLP
jgi:hypothetical protein